MKVTLEGARGCQRLWRRGETLVLAAVEREADKLGRVRFRCVSAAVAESFFHSLKTERPHHEKYRNRTHARLRIVEYIEVFYHRSRKHSSLNYMAPLVYEENAN